MLDEGVTCPEFQGPRYITDTQHHRTTEGTGRAGEPLKESRLALVFRLDEDAGRMMSASKVSATRSDITLNEPLACVRSKARRNW